ncbi:MAG: alpha-amylase, partial [Bradyrhizobium sp.]
VEEQRILVASAHPGESDEQTPYLRYMTQSGRRIGEMHVALAGNSELPEFAPEPCRREDLQRWVDDILARAERIFDTFRQRRDSLKEPDRVLADQLLALEKDLPTLLNEMLPREIDSFNIRLHGDLHLGQMLIVKDDIFIIDFEGEPRRTILERRRKAPAARDVAGLIRSIDYSATAAYERALKFFPDEHHNRLAVALAEWRDRATDAFLASYHEATEGQRFWPTDHDAAAQILNFFLVEKAFYEVEYELAHRPDWLRVPLTGIIRILSHKPEEDAS